ncbi:ribonuclease P protein component [Luteibaculum oceani]|uniref:Ribonuclease P protein component n=1 Tax=Luteibaculum oceani TaxID=1294296 RepID=A0A5C6VKC9_9FLAO|nr:ribonuclease P protein component [Luteibaculum oceani]TXC85121.1 ribonuclease P protein component [Luteibaculum oceani]
MPNTFPKSEKLKSRKAIKSLFEGGIRIGKFPVQVFYLPGDTDEANGVKAGFSVSKRKVRSAVNRNRIKRLMREAYRLNKSGLLEITRDRGISLNVFWVYQATEEFNFTEIESKISFLINRLIEQLQEDEK